MATVNRDILRPYLDAYRNYLNRQERGENVSPLRNVQEDYKRGIAVKAAEILNKESWTEIEIGEGAIGDRAIKAVQRNLNLIGRFQVSGFADKVKEDFSVSERLLYDLYHLLASLPIRNGELGSCILMFRKTISLSTFA